MTDRQSTRGVRLSGHRRDRRKFPAHRGGRVRRRVAALRSARPRRRRPARSVRTAARGAADPAACPALLRRRRLSPAHRRSGSPARRLVRHARRQACRRRRRPGRGTGRFRRHPPGRDRRAVCPQDHSDERSQPRRAAPAGLGPGGADRDGDAAPRTRDHRTRCERRAPPRDRPLRDSLSPGPVGAHVRRGQPHDRLRPSGQWLRLARPRRDGGAGGVPYRHRSGTDRARRRGRRGLAACVRLARAHPARRATGPRTRGGRGPRAEDGRGRHAHRAARPWWPTSRPTSRHASRPRTRSSTWMPPDVASWCGRSRRSARNAT